MLKETVTRRIIETILEQGLKFGLDVAGGFLGPAWPFVKPLVEKLLKGMPKDIAGRYKSSREAARQVRKELDKHQAEVAKITEALDEQGLTAEWAEEVLGGLQKLSDDHAEILLRQSAQLEKLDEVLALVDSLKRPDGGRIVFRGERLEYVDFVTVPDDFLRGYDLAPGTVITESFPGRHASAGFFIWNFMMFNDGGQLAVISKMEVRVQGEYPFPEGSEPGGVLPLIEAFEDEIRLEPGRQAYPVFVGKQFKYAPGTDVDSFRIRAIFQGGRRLIQQLQLRVHWSDGTGDHVTRGSPLFLASLEKPQLGVSSSKFGWKEE